MALILETIHTDGIAQISYILGDDETGTACIIDPAPVPKKYIDFLIKSKLSLTHIFETHIHADFFSGSRDLAELVPNAKIYLSKEGEANYDFEHEDLKDGDNFSFGNTKLVVKHTPGHTPEHVSFLAYDFEVSDGKEPWGVFTGDSLFVNSAGRPDLLGSDESEKLAEQQFNTLRDFYYNLPPSVVIYPGHGKGSSCGADIGDRLTSTIGYEKEFNPFLQIVDLDEFKDFAINGAPSEPSYYRSMKKLNAGQESIKRLEKTIKPLPPHAFDKALKDSDALLVDTRSMLSFGGGHIPNAVNIGARPELSIWAGWIIKRDTPLLLVLESDSDLERVKQLFLNTGYSNIVGYLAGGMTAWVNKGLPIDRVMQMSVQELNNRTEQTEILDVRSPEEWEGGHIPEAKHVFLPELREKLDQFDKASPIVTYCHSGYRASIAASLLKMNDFQVVFSVPGSFQAWTNANFEVVKD